MNIRTALVVASVLTLPVAAFAQPVDGLYVGAGAGYNYLQSQRVKTSPSQNIPAASGVVALGSVGYGFGNGLRVELQGDFRSSVQSSQSAGFKARNETYGGFVNGLFDLDVGADFVFPYIGVGVGYEEQSLKSRDFSGSNGSYTTASKGGVAAQAILGVSFPIPDAPGLSVTAEYRFMSTLEDRTFKGVKFGPEYNHSGLLGLRYALGVEAPMMAPAPAPAPTVAPAPAPARTYLVFFDWDKADLTARAKQIIAEAAQNVSRVKVTRIEVSGHADRTGTASYNQKLSLRRAQNVAAELVRLGVPQAEIAVMAYGDTHPLVPTAAGVREPQNRRVEIVLK